MEPLVEATNGNGGFTAPAEYPGFQAPSRHTLPSGAVFLLRRPQILKMMRRGLIPNPLMEIVNKSLMDRDERDTAAEAEAKGLTVEELEEQRREEAERKAETEAPPMPEGLNDIDAATAFSFRDVVIWAAIVEPKVEIEPMVGDSPTTASGALSFDAISDEDCNYIMGWVNGEIADAATFPGVDVERARPGGDGGAVRDEAVAVVGHPA